MQVCRLDSPQLIYFSVAENDFHVTLTNTRRGNDESCIIDTDILHVTPSERQVLAVFNIQGSKGGFEHRTLLHFTKQFVKQTLQHYTMSSGSAFTLELRTRSWITIPFLMLQFFYIEEEEEKSFDEI